MTMCGLRHLAILLLVCGAWRAQAQSTSNPDSAEKDTYAIVLYAGGGFSSLVSEAGVPRHLDTRLTTLGPCGTARLMWLPDHRLRLGLESGWTTFYSYDIEGPDATGRMELVGVPLLITWSMPLTKRLSVFAGYGVYRLTTRLDLFGSTTTSFYSMGYAAALSYVYPINDRVGLALEGKWMNAAETRHTLLGAQMQLVWKLHRW